jgi:hypothetical protein
MQVGHLQRTHPPILSSAVGDTQITVRYTKNGASDSDSSAPITVHKPTALLVVSDTTNPTGENCSVHCLDKIGSTCATTTAKSTTCSYSSYLRTRQYSVLDQLTPANQFQNVGITAATITESQPFVTTCTNATLPVRSATTSVFTDSFFLCHTCCLQGGPGCSAGTNPVQTISVNGEAVRTETINWSCSNVTLNP